MCFVSAVGKATYTLLGKKMPFIFSVSPGCAEAPDK